MPLRQGIRPLSGTLAALALLAVATAIGPAAKAEPIEHRCADYARDQAGDGNSKAIDVALGAGAGAVGGALIAGAVDGGITAGTAALIGGGLGAAFGFHDMNLYGHVYRSAYYACMQGEAGR